MSFYLVLALFGGLAGITTVLFGFGGGFVVVPLLYSLLIAVHGQDSAIGQMAMHVAVATSSCVMIAGALLATIRHQRARTLDWRPVRPLLGFIAIGAAFGAAGATLVHGAWIRWAFIVYLALTIVDCLFRPGFMSRGGQRTGIPTPGITAFAGLAVGAVAGFLGVGGSVMTVPLMRRRGVGMSQATAMANPLSIPVALAGTTTFILLAPNDAATLGDWHAGFVDLRAFAVLVAGSWIGIRLGAPLIGRIPDAVHAKAYLVLLSIVLVVMLIR